MKDSSQRLAKRNVATALLTKGSVFIHLDPRVENVTVPHWLTQQSHLVLQVGWQMPIPIPDLRVDDEGIFGTLSFSRVPYGCNLPWAAVFALVGEEGKGMVWDESMPAEIAHEVQEAKKKKTATSGAPFQGIKPVLSVQKQPKKKLPPYLRVIK